jgi:hypothetical protein
MGEQAIAGNRLNVVLEDLRSTTQLIRQKDAVVESIAAGSGGL